MVEEKIEGFIIGEEGERIRKSITRKPDPWWRKMIYFIVAISGTIGVIGSLFISSFLAWEIYKTGEKLDHIIELTETLVEQGQNK